MRSKFEEAWKVKLPEAIGKASTQMIEWEVGIKGLYILGEDPAQTDPDTNRIRDALEAMDFVVVQEIFPTETN